MIQIFDGVDLVDSEEPGLLVQRRQLPEILAHEKRHPLDGCRIFGNDLQFKTVPDVQRMQTRGFGMRLHLQSVCLGCVDLFLRKGCSSAIICRYSVAYLLQ